MFNFTAEIEGTRFELRAVNIKQLQLFHVYVPFEGQTARFHMKWNGDKEFVIADPDKVPGPFKHLEKELSAAIFQYDEQRGS